MNDANDMHNSPADRPEEIRLRELLHYEKTSRILAHWEPVRYMDSGTFSYIFQVRSRQAGTDAVLKFIPNPKDLLDCHEQGSPEDLFFQTRFAAAKREAEIMGKFRGNAHVVQYLEEPEYLKRSFVNAQGETVRQYAVLICMPLYRNHKEWQKAIEGDRNARLQLGIEISEALIAFEEKGVYHRDIKPGNILMDDAGHFCLGDVGEAKLESEFTTTGFHGTRPYMAPEVYNQENERKKMHSDHRSDIYSLGIILYRLFNRGQFPFLQASGELTMDARTTFKSYSEKYGAKIDEQYLTDGERARLLRYDGAKLPIPCEADPQLGRVILRACAYRKEDRYATAAEMRDDLRCCMEGKSIGTKKKNNRMALAAGGCLLAAVIVGGMVLAAGGSLLAAVIVGGMACFVRLWEEKRNTDVTPVPTIDTNATTTNVIETPTPTSMPTATPIPTPTLTPVVLESAAAKDYTYDVKIDYTGQKYIAITGYKGPEDADLIIPASIQGLPVRKIADSAFARRGDLTGKLSISDGVMSIGDDAFRGCNGLTGVLTIPDSVTSIGDFAFSFCNGLTGALTIPDSVTSIGNSAFRRCSGFTGELTIPDSVTSIGYDAFNGCSGFTGALTIPDSVTSIGYGAFDGCSGFTGVLTIPDSVTSIGNRAFNGCSGFTGALTIPENVMSIGYDVFNGCSGFIGALTIPDSVTSIGDNAFRDCSGFIGTLIIPENVMSIGYGAFDGCSGLTGALIIPDSVISIGDYAFKGCNGLTGALTIPNSVTSIGKSAFEGCSFTEVRGKKGSLAESVAKELGVKFVEYHTVVPDGNEELTVLESATTENYIYAIKMEHAGQKYIAITGYNGPNDADLIIPASIQGLPVREIADSAFFFKNKLTGRLVLPNSIVSIGNSAFGGCSGLAGELVIPDSVTSIGNCAFSGCSNFTGELTIPNSVTSIGKSAFSDCIGFTGELTIPNSVTSIGSSAFLRCRGFSGMLTISDGVTKIGDNAFMGCCGLTGTVTIPDSVTSIGKSVFYGCDFTEIYGKKGTLAENVARDLGVKFIEYHE